jgi:hypothetical protein
LLSYIFWNEHCAPRAPQQIRSQQDPEQPVGQAGTKMLPREGMRNEGEFGRNPGRAHDKPKRSKGRAQEKSRGEEKRQEDLRGGKMNPGAAQGKFRRICGRSRRQPK